MAAATLKSIARASGFSVTTVSRALGGYDDVNENTRQIILEEARRQGYEPHLLARLLQGQRSQTLCLVVPINAPRFLDPFFSEFVAGVGHEASSSGFDLLISTVDSEHNTLEPYRRLVAGRRVDGFILTRTHHDDPRIRFLAEKNQPFVVFGRTNKGNDFAHIDVEGDAGQAALTEHFIEYCHRRIGYIAPPPDLMFTHLRLRGFREGMARHDLPVDDNLIVHGDLTERGGYTAAQDLLEVSDRPTAIMTGNDLMAFGAMRAIEERGLKVGDDIAVGGFDDIPLAELVHPTLTTLRQPIYEIGRRLASTLLHMLAGEEIPDRAILLRPELIIRESSGFSCR